MYKLNYDYILLHLYRNTVDINIFVLLFCVGLDSNNIFDLYYYHGEQWFNFVIDLLIDACESLLDYLIEAGDVRG